MISKEERARTRKEGHCGFCMGTDLLDALDVMERERAALAHPEGAALLERLRSAEARADASRVVEDTMREALTKAEARLAKAEADLFRAREGLEEADVIAHRAEHRATKAEALAAARLAALRVAVEEGASHTNDCLYDRDTEKGCWCVALVWSEQNEM